MGLLANAFSYGDSLKRKVGGLLADPRGTLEQFVGQLGDDTNTNIRNMQLGYGFGGKKSNDPAQVAAAQRALADYGAQSGMAGLIGGKSFVYPQDKALATAQRNAAKPVSEGGLGLRPDNTAAERAKAMGFEDAFHGSKRPEGIENLVAGGRDGAIRHGDAYGTGVYTTTDAVGDASSYGSGGAVFPLKIDRTNHLPVDAPNADDLRKLSKFAGDSMLPSDKARFSVGRETRQFKDLQEARDFFANQRENWKQFGDGMDRAKPEAISNPDGTFGVKFTNWDAPVPITNGKDADTMFRALGYDNIPALGYSGHTLDRGAGRLWDITNDTSKLRSRFAAFDPMRRNESDLLGRADPALLGILGGGSLLGLGAYNYSKD